MAGQGLARRVQAGRVQAPLPRHGEARRGLARLTGRDKAWLEQGSPLLFLARYGMARLGFPFAWQFWARRGGLRLGESWRGTAR